MNKFEQLIEYVINDEEQKARDLFHEIVVEKSRGIYEELMSEEEIEEAVDEELDEAESTHDEDEKAEKAGRKVAKDIEYDDKKDRMDEDEDLEENFEGMDTMGGDQADSLIDDIETEEQGLSMEGEDEEGMADEEGSEDLEDRVVDLEDKLDELMAEFEALMGDDGQEGEDELDIEVGGDDIETDGMGPGEEEEMDTEFETMEGTELEEAINLKAAPAPVKSEEGNINKKSTVAANSGARGMDGKPVMSNGADEKGRSAPTTKPLIGDVQNSPAKSTVKQSPATKPHLAQGTGVNTKSPVA
jgi:hypothetical protein